MKKYQARVCAGLLLLGMGLGGCGGSPQDGKNGGPVVVMTWNVQALFDGTETGNEYAEYREAAGWSKEKYAGRVQAIVQAIGGMEPAPPDIIALQEIESARTLEDLAGGLSKQGFRWTHFTAQPEAPLGLGIISRFPLEETRVHSISVDGAVAPRPVLETRVSAHGGALTLFVCHWKSKLGGEDATEAARRTSARIILRRLRELAAQEPDMPVIIMGDLNENHDEFFRRNSAVISALLPDDPRSAELVRTRGPAAPADAAGLQTDFLILSPDKPPQARHFPPGSVLVYSPWAEELANGSYYYKDQWETIDHFLLSAQLFNGRGWEFENSVVAAYQPFTNPDGRPAAYKTGNGSGLSDHLPLLLFLTYREAD